MGPIPKNISLCNYSYFAVIYGFFPNLCANLDSKYNVELDFVLRRK